jgi:hypothetical protein
MQRQARGARAYWPNAFVIIPTMKTRATRPVGITTNQNPLFLQKFLPAGARFPRLAEVLIPSASPDSCRARVTLLKASETSLRRITEASYEENRLDRPLYERFAGPSQCTTLAAVCTNDSQRKRIDITLETFLKASGRLY